MEEPTMVQPSTPPGAPIISPYYVCPICGDDNQEVTNFDAVVLVPILGSNTCRELLELAENGEINESQCGIVQLMTPTVCDCQPSPATTTTTTTTPTDEPNTTTLSPAGGTTSPAMAPDAGPSLPSSPTSRPPSVTMSPSLLSEDCRPLSSQIDANELVISVTLNIQLDAKPQETGWYIVDENNACFRLDKPALAYKTVGSRNSTESVSETIFLQRGGRYMLVMEDSNGDGLCCGVQDGQVGSYSLLSSSGDITLASGQGDFGYEEISFFTAPDM